MKKTTAILMGAIILLSSCATITNHGKATTTQRTKPAPGQPQREIRVGAFVADILLGIWPLGIDYATGAIYKKSPGEKAEKKK